MSSKITCRFFAVSVLTAASTAAWGSEIAFDVEYLPESDYESALGVGGYRIEDSGIGFYGNIQLTLTPREPHYDSLDTGSYGDPVTGRYQDIFLANIGLTKKFADGVSGYAGLGFVSVTGVAEKHDPLHILASDGTYYVDDPENDDSGMNLNTGVIFGLGSFALNLGYHSFTNSLYFGAGMKF
jgi:hypothetical protein